GSERRALLSDLPTLHAPHSHPSSRLLGTPLRVDHPQTAAAVRSLDGVDYVLMTEGDQGMPWTTLASRSLNQIVVDAPQVFRLVEIFLLPSGDSVRLYSVHRGEAGRRTD